MKSWRSICRWQLRDGLVFISGALLGLLIARLVLKLFAARPDNPSVQWLYALTDPFVAPFALIDRGQPRFGAILELSTLATLLVGAAVTALLWFWLGAREPSSTTREEHPSVLTEDSDNE